MNSTLRSDEEQNTLTKSMIIKFKLSYLTMLILNMAFMRENLQYAFNFNESIHSEEFSFMEEIDEKFKNMKITNFIGHIRHHRK